MTAFRRGAGRRTGLPCTLGDFGAIRRMRAIATRYGRSDAREVFAPLRLDARGIAQVLLVERVEEVGVAGVQSAGLDHGCPAFRRHSPKRKIAVNSMA